MELSIVPGLEGIITYDSDSILVLTYIKLGGCPVKINDMVSHGLRLSELPLLRHAEIETRSPSEIISYLRSQNYGLEYGLSDMESVDLASLESLIERHFTPALNWFLWNDDTVFANFTRKCYTSSISWFAKLYAPFRWRRDNIYRARHSQLTHCLRSMSDPDVGNELYTLAKRCLTTLSYVLGTKTYFVGDRPTAADAYLFARLWPLLLYESRHGFVDWTNLSPSSVPSGQSLSHLLVVHLLQCPNLVSHFIRIQNEHFPKAATVFRREITSNASKRQRTAGLLSAHPVRDCLLVGAGVLGAFLLYAKNVGLIRVTSA